MAQHYSFRVPWHDNGWRGTICSNPSENYACMRLKGINQSRNESLEDECAECKFCDLNCVDDIPCIREGGGFMSEEDVSVTISHPYSNWSDNHRHLLPLTETIPAYSYPARPFRWVMRQRYIGNRQYKYIGDAVYWATVSLTTVGYGDIYPVSTMGRIITMLSSILGIAIVALPAGIITAGYMSELEKRSEKRESHKNNDANKGVDDEYDN